MDHLHSRPMYGVRHVGSVITREEPSPSQEIRNWLELPSDVIFHIFLKLGEIDILFRAQSVCSLWRKVSKEPLLFRSIDMRNRSDLLDDSLYNVEKMAREAVDRSCGQLVDFAMDDFGSDELLAHIADMGEALFAMAKKAVMLEELEICHCSLSEDTLIGVGNACPQLKSLWLHRRGYRWPHIECDNEALAIAGNVPELRHLHLFGNKLTNVGLKAILDGCLHLESLDLRQCFNINLEGDLLKSCRDRLIKVKLPNDSTDDCEFDAAIDDRSYEFPEGSCYSELDHGIFSDDDFGYNPSFDFDQYDPDLIYDNELPFDQDYYGTIHILLSAQSVCSTWRKVSKEPSLFRSIDMRNRSDLFDGKMYDLEKLAREAVDRSCGQLVEFSMDGFGNNELLAQIADKSCELRCLRLVSSYQIRGGALMNVAKKAVMLEELEIRHCSLLEDTLLAVGNACPQLKTLRLNSRSYRGAHVETHCDNEALAIAGNMPELRHLRLFGNNLTNVGLKAILDGCLHLESLDLRQCFNVNLEGDLLRSCGDRLIKLRLPNDSTDDYEFDDAIESVCSAWPEVSKEPSLFRSIEISLDMQNRWRHAGLFEDRLYQLEKLAKESADRSCGQLVKFSMERFDSDELLAYIADNDSLRCLRLVSCDKVSEDALVNMAKKAVLLEELEICHCSFSADMLKTIGKVWPQLKSFRLNRRGYRFPHRERDDEALAIAENMPQLRRPFSMAACTLNLSTSVNASTLILKGIY
ncbi:hypothetical protein C5167_009845 [Papaver somniferum]|uniref:F-box domain-containing protein n=1 Tax=Papaver somniferum TaxID=3469 RepID=A0A4Y7K1E1_PAPSO|nr:hypothetical protein C5167_009845 [Papaver somniferum]